MIKTKLSLESHEPKRRLVYVIFLVVWALKLISGLVDIAERHVPAYPDAVKGAPDIGQWGFYVAVPVALVAFNLLMIVFANKFPCWSNFVFAVLQTIALPLLLLMGGGGV